MDAFAVRLLVGIGIIVLTQFALDGFKVREPAKNTVFVLVVIISCLYIVAGNYILRLVG